MSDISAEELEAMLAARFPTQTVRDGFYLEHQSDSCVVSADGDLRATFRVYEFADGAVRDMSEQEVLVLLAADRAQRARFAHMLDYADDCVSEAQTLLPSDCFPQRPVVSLPKEAAPARIDVLPDWAPADPEEDGDEVHELVALADCTAILARNGYADLEAAVAAGYVALPLYDADAIEHFADLDQPPSAAKIALRADAVYRDLVALAPPPPRVPDLQRVLPALLANAKSLADVARVVADAPARVTPKLEAEDAGDEDALPASELFSMNEEPSAHLLVPACTIEEALVVIRFGNFNACPDTAFHVAMLRKWQQRYGAELAYMGHDLLCVTLARVPETAEELADARRDVSMMSADESSDVRSYVWRFWWD